MNEELVAWVESHRLSIILGIVGFIFVISGLGLTFKVFNTSPPLEILDESTTAISPKMISVDIAGAVAHPGLYQLQEGSRVEGLLLLAGGFLPSVDKSYIEKNLNRSLRLSDGQKVYIPAKDEQSNLGVIKTNSVNSNTLGIQTATININSASLSQLDTLTGVGEVTAQKIISGRPYQSTDDLLNRKIVNQGVWKKIKDKISVY